MKKSIFLGKWFLCVLGAAVLAGSAGFTAGAAGTEGLETGWEKEQETIRETGREEDLEMNPEKMAEIRDQTEANMLGEFDFSELDNSLLSLFPKEKLRFEDVTAAMII